MRLEQEVNIYGDAEILKRFQAAETSISVVQGNISALISESELIELQNSHTTMYSQMASLKLDVDDLELSFSDLQTKYNTVTGQYTELSSKVAEYKAGVDGLSADITAVEQNLEKNYSTTTEMNAAIEASVDGLSSTVSKTYATTTQVTAAQNNAISSAKSYTDTQKTSALETAKGYADDAEAAANANTKNLLKNYSTTIQMNSAINQKANEITASVSGTYATKSALNNANSEIDALQSWKNEASLKITDSAIVATVTSSSSWATKADKANLISQINQSAEQVAISASKIKLEGIITANGNFKILADGSMETINGRLGGWTIGGNNMIDDKTDFMVRIAAPTVYGGDGNGNADVLVIRDKINDTYPLVISSNGQVLATKCKFEGGTIGGWKITGTDIYNDNGVQSAGIGKVDVSFAFWAGATYANRNTAPFRVGHAGNLIAANANITGSITATSGSIGGWKITETELYCDAGSNSCGISKYGTSLAFWAGETVANRNNAIFRVWHDGSIEIKGFMHYSKQGWDTPDGKVHTSIGGWQIKTASWDGYPTTIYWDTDDSQKNGIAADGPWVIWGGWNGGASMNTDNYKFVVTAEGVCKAMSWVTGSRVEWKENIVPYQKSALQEIANSEVYYYDLKDRGKGQWKEGRHIGFVIGDGYSVSPDILDGGGGAIDMYSALAIAYKAIQEQQIEIEELKKKIKEVAA